MKKHQVPVVKNSSASASQHRHGADINAVVEFEELAEARRRDARPRLPPSRLKNVLRVPPASRLPQRSDRMPRFAANLTMLFNEAPFLTFALAANAGSKA